MEHIGTKEINSERLKLRRYKLDDAKEMVDGYVNQKEFLYYSRHTPVNLDEETQELQTVEEKYASVEDYYNWAITLKSTGAIIGGIHLHMNLANDSAVFNYAIDNHYVNNGYMTEALNAVKDYAFNEIKLNRFEGACVQKNNASKRVMEKCGFIYEGTKRKCVKLCDGYHDMLVFGLVKSDFNK